MLKDWRLFAPAISGFGMSSFCGIIEGGESLPQTPPKSTFQIVWPILFFLLGMSWTKAKKVPLLDALHAVCTALLAGWIYVYTCRNSKKMGIYILAVTISIVIACITIHEKAVDKVLLVPLLAWLIIAFQLNWEIVNRLS